MKRTLIALALLVSANAANAALVCVNGDTGEQVQWSVGKPVPSINLDGPITCAANGAELQYIRDKFTGIPMRTGAVSRTLLFRGDVAVFIIDNL